MRSQYKTILGGLLIASALLNTGCNEGSIIKADVAPGSNALNPTTVTDDFNIISKTTYSGRVITSDRVDGVRVIQGLGHIEDPFFGKTNAGIYFQVLPDDNDFRFTAVGTSYTLDSAVLILPYTGFSWGNTGTPMNQTFTVYRVTEPMSVETDYYSNDGVIVDRANPISVPTEINMERALKDTPFVINENAAYKHLRIPLTDAFQQNVQNLIGTTVFNTEANFLSTFNGFYVEPDSNKGGDLIPYFFMDGNENYARAAIAFYYREAGSSETKVKFFNYQRDKTANYNKISRNYTGTPVQNLFESYTNNPTVSDDRVAVQNGPGASIDLTIQNLNKVPLSAILKAEIVLTQISTGNAADSLVTPARLNIKGIDETGAEYDIQDLQSTSATAAVALVDGNKRFEKDATGTDVIRYRLNIPRELQKAITDGRNELHLRITSAKGFPGAYRLVAGGRGHSTNGIQFNVVYSTPN